MMQKHESYASYKLRYAREQKERAAQCCAHPRMIVRVSDRQPMHYANKMLIPAVGGVKPTVFPSGRKARVAKWHHVQQSGIPMSHVLWEIVPV